MASAPPQDRVQRPLRPTGPIRHQVSVSPSSAPAAARQLDGQAEQRSAELRRTGPLRMQAGEARPTQSQPSPDVLLLEPKTLVAPALHAARPSAGEMLMHPFKSLSMLVALLVDRRVSRVRKLAFAVPVALLVLGLLIPETLFGVFSGLVAPVVGLVLDVPIDAGVDWLGVGLLAVALLSVFPKAIVAQYHAQLFHHAAAARR